MLLTRIVTFILLKCILSEGINVTVEYDNDNACGSMVRIECGTEGYGIVFQLIYPNSTKTVAIAECQFGPRAYSQLMSGTFIGTYNVTMTTSTCILIILHLTTEQCGIYGCALMYNQTQNVSRNISCKEAQTVGVISWIIVPVGLVSVVIVVCLVICIYCQRKRSRHMPDAQPVGNVDERTACIPNGPGFDNANSVTDLIASVDTNPHSLLIKIKPVLNISLDHTTNSKNVSGGDQEEIRSVVNNSNYHKIDDANGPCGGHVEDEIPAPFVTHYNDAENEPLKKPIDNTAVPKSVVVSKDLLKQILDDDAETKSCTEADDISPAEEIRRQITMDRRNDLKILQKRKN